MTKTDRELLEFAAKAAGYIVERWTDDGTALLLRGIQEPWNPLHENPHSDCMGDALRLAVLLRLDVDHEHLGVNVWGADVFYEPHGADPYAATRHAIVRAAAAIGEQMP